MSKVVDSKVVEMRFDNKQFEQGVETSMNTIDKLKAKLNLPGATDSLEEVSSATDRIRDKFSALDVVVVTTLANLTNSAINAGKKMVSSLINPLIEGGKTRASNIEQAMFQFKGLGMDVEATMADASYAVDGTAYSLDAAAKVASQLGASGMRAGEQMRTSLRAVSGVAAMAGASYEDIGNVFTTVAGQGRVMGMDLMRLSSRGINAAATLGKHFNKTEAEIREMVTKGKVSFEMFSEAMDAAFGEHASAANETYAGSLSNVRAALGRIGEKFYTPFHQNMIKPLNSFRNVINQVNTAVTPLFDLLASGMEKVSKKVTNLLDNVDLSKLTDGIKKFVDGIKMGAGESDKLARSFSGLKSILELLGRAFKFVFNIAKELFSAFGGPLINGILTVTAKIGDLITRFKDFIVQGDILNKSFTILKDVFHTVADKVTSAVTRISDAIGKFRKVDTDGIEEVGMKVEKGFRPFTTIAKIVSGAIELVTRTIEWALPIIKKVATKIGEILKSIADAVINAFKTGDYKGALDVINVGLLGTFVVGLRDFMKSFSGVLGKFKDFGSGLKSVLDDLHKTFKLYQETLKANVLMTIAKAIAVLAGSLFLLAMIPSDKLMGATVAITVLFSELAITLKALGGMFKSKDISFMKLSSMLVALSSAILILSFAMRNLARLDWAGVAKGVTGIGALLYMLFKFSDEMAKNKVKLVKGSTNLMKFAATLWILTKAVKNLGEMEWEGLAKGILGIAAVMASLAGFSRIVKPEGLNKLGASIILLGAGLRVIASAVKKMGTIDLIDLGKGLGSVVILLASIAGFSQIVKTKGLIKAGTALIFISTGLIILSKAVKQLGNLELESLKKGLIGLVSILASIAAFTNLIDTKGIVRIGFSLILMSAGLLVMVQAVKQLGGLNLPHLVNGLIGLAGILASIAIFTNLVSTSGILRLSAAMLVMSTSLAVLARVVKTLGSLAIGDAILGLTALAGILTVVGAAAFYIGPMAKSMALLGGAMIALGAGLTFIGAGLVAVNLAFSSFMVSAASAAASIEIIGGAIIGLIPMLLTRIAEGILGFGSVLIKGIETIKNILLTLIVAALEVLVEAVPKFVETLFIIVRAVLDGLVENAPYIVDRLFELIIQVLKTLEARLPELISAVADVLRSFYSSLLSEFEGITLQGLMKLLGATSLITALMFALSKVGPFIPGAMVGVLGISAVVAEIGLVIAAFGVLSKLPGLMWLVKGGGALLEAIGVAIGSFIGGIAGGVLGGMSSQMPKIGTNLAEFMENIQPFIDGAKGITSESLSGVKTLTETIVLLTAANILDGIAKFLTGGRSIGDFAEQLIPFGKAMKDFANEVKGIDQSSITDAANAGKILAEMGTTLPKSGGVVGFILGSSDMEQFSEHLVIFGKAMKEFSNEVKGLDASVVENAANAGKALTEMATTIPNTGGVVGFFTGNNDIDKFGEMLVPFGKAMKEFSDEIKGLDSEVIKEASVAGLALTELANSLPETGGLVGLLKGNKNLGKLGKYLAPLGKSMKEFSDSAKGLDTSVVNAAANSGKALAEMVAALPEQGTVAKVLGVAPDMVSFAAYLPSLGTSMVEFSSNLSGLKAGVVDSAATAGKTLAEMVATLPQSGTMSKVLGVAPDMATFATYLPGLGTSMVKFSKEVSGLNSKTIETAATAGKVIADLVAVLPEQSTAEKIFGIAPDMAIFAGYLPSLGTSIKEFSDNALGLNIGVVSIASAAGKIIAELVETLPEQSTAEKVFGIAPDAAIFASYLPALGTSIKSFSDNAKGLNSAVVTSAAAAGEVIAGLVETLPEQSTAEKVFGIAPDAKIFAGYLPPLGSSIKEFSDNAKGLNSGVVTAASAAGETIAALVASLPEQDKVEKIFGIAPDMAVFAAYIPPLGTSVKQFADNAAGLDISVAVAASAAGSAIAELVTALPEQGLAEKAFGIAPDMAIFAAYLPALGRSIKEFSDSAKGVKPQVVSDAASAGQAIAELVRTLPEQGLAEKVFGVAPDMATFAAYIPELGTAIKAFSENSTGIKPEVVTAASSAGQAIAEFVKVLPEQSTAEKIFGVAPDMAVFSSYLPTLGTSLKEFANNVSGFKEDGVASAISAAEAVAGLVSTLPEQDTAEKVFGIAPDMAIFAEYLPELGTSLKAFSDNVSGLKADIVEEASAAGETIAAFVEVLPEQSAGEKVFGIAPDMAVFAGYLPDLGTALKQFSDNVEGLNTDTVTVAAAAGKTLAELVATLPEAGKTAKIVPSMSDISIFSAHLPELGTAMTKFSNNIDGFNPDTTTVAAAAGMSLTEMAGSLPSLSGASTWIADLNLFGESLPSFGTAMKSFSDAIIGLDPNVVTNSTNVAQAVAALADILPKNGGLASLFAGSADLEEVGRSLVIFGGHLVSYSAYAASISVEAMSAATEEFKKLADVAKSIENSDASNLVSFSESLESLGTSGVDAFIKAFTDAAPKVKTEAEKMITSFIEGAESKKIDLENTFTKLVEAAKKKLEDKYPQFKTVGGELMVKLIAGVKSKDAAVKNAFTNSLGDAVTAVRNYYSQFRSAGSYLVDGFASGITSNTFKAAAQAREMANAAANAAAKALDERSPSRVLYKIGSLGAIGFINAFSDYTKHSFDAGSKFANTATKGMAEAIDKILEVVDEEVELQPTIRPVLDLSNVRTGTKELDVMFNHNKALSISAESPLAQAQNNQNGSKWQTGGNISFVQNNYSPKALSRIEIYRQTRNQFSAMERMVRA